MADDSERSQNDGDEQRDGHEPPSREHVEKLKAADAREIHRTVREEGQDELDRPATSLFWSGLAAGIAINTSLIAEGALRQHLPDMPGRDLITGLGYPIGFLIVIFGRLQLFTESTITAMLPLVTQPSWQALRKTLRLWTVVLGANLVGTALAGGSVAAHLLGTAELRTAMIESSMKITEHGALDTFLGAIPAGFLIAIVAWSLPNARPQSFFTIFAFTYVIAIAGFSHSIVGSVEAFLLMFSGHLAPLATVTGFMLPAIVGNLLGGAGLFALLAHAQVRSEMPDDLKED